MENIINAPEKLFSYGTLRYETVQLSTFGRKLNGCVDALVGYKLSQLQILDPDVVAVSGEDVHPILVATNDKDDQVPGMVFDVTLEEIMLQKNLLNSTGFFSAANKGIELCGVLFFDFLLFILKCCYITN